MPKIESHANGMPCWVDVMVETSEQRQAVMDFYSSLYGWTWDVNGEEMGYYSIANLEGSPVMGVGQGPGGAGAMVPYFATDDIDASLAKATELGGTVIMGRQEVPFTGVMALVADPTGAMHGLWQPTGFNGFGVVYEVGSPGWFDHASNEPDKASGLLQRPHRPRPARTGARHEGAGQWRAVVRVDFPESSTGTTSGPVELDLHRRVASTTPATRSARWAPPWCSRRCPFPEVRSRSSSSPP